MTNENEKIIGDSQTVREMKFRAWNNTRKNMCYFGLLDDTLQETIEKDFDKESHNTVMQYTGLKDKNAKKIYEGDIINIKRHGTCRVIFECGGFIARHNLGWQNFITMQYSGSRCEVIGNIYENPDML